MKCSVSRQFLAAALMAFTIGAHAQTSLISTGAVWKYLDNGSDPGPAWTQTEFNDSLWASGRAELGYGDGDEATTNSFGPDPNNKFITTYYRHGFTLGNSATLTNLMLRLLRDDGAVVYLNGAEVFRSNMPTGQVSSATQALRAISGAEEVNFIQTMIDPNRLQNGTNVIAVEIHQATNNSSDISFNLGLVANQPMLPALVHLGSVWKFSDHGTNPPADWRTLEFDDSAWLDGPAQLGYGDGDEATRINSGPATNVFLAYYFRHVFDVTAPEQFSNLVVRVLRDDGAIVYLNDVEVFRNNMPAGPADVTTEASDVINIPQESQFYGRRINPTLLRAGANVLAVQIHQGSATSSDVSFDLELLPNVPETGPEIAITMPMDGARYTEPADISILAAATDFDGVVTNVLFLLNGVSAGKDRSEPYSIVSSNHLAGMHTLEAIAMDDSGRNTTSAPVHIQILTPPYVSELVTNGAWWRFFDGGGDAGPTWRQLIFNDTGWGYGPAQFGYGENDEATPINPGNPRIITHYFRYRFEVARASDFTNLLFQVLRDDGVVVYLNDQEVFRMNMPPGAILFTTPAASPVGSTNETFYFPTNISASVLVNGSNILAVELHQTATTTDASFDLNLTGIGPPRPNRPLLDHSRATGPLVLRWTDPNAVLEETILPSGSWNTVTNTGPYEVPAGPSRLFRLRSTSGTR